VTVDVAADVAIDASSNNNLVATQAVQAYDTSTPTALLTVDNKNSDSNLDQGETITIVFSEAVDVDSLVLGSQFSPTVLTRADEAKLGTGYSVAASSSGTATTFVITLGADNSTTDLDLLVSSTASDRTLTFNKSAIIDASSNTAASHIALVLPADMQKPTAVSTTHTSTNVAATSAYAAGETIRLVLSEGVDTSKFTTANLLSTGTMGSSALTAVNASGGFATTFDLTVASDATLAANNTIKIASSNVLDQNGNSSAGDFLTFTLPSTVRVTGAADQNLSITKTQLDALLALEATGTGTITVTGATGSALTADLAKLTAASNTISVTGADGQNLSVSKTQLDTISALVATGFWYNHCHGRYNCSA
jgi:hypothetical protein